MYDYILLLPSAHRTTTKNNVYEIFKDKQIFISPKEIVESPTVHKTNKYVCCLRGCSTALVCIDLRAQPLWNILCLFLFETVPYDVKKQSIWFRIKRIICIFTLRRRIQEKGTILTHSYFFIGEIFCPFFHLNFESNGTWESYFEQIKPCLLSSAWLETFFIPFQFL